MSATVCPGCGSSCPPISDPGHNSQESAEPAGDSIVHLFRDSREVPVGGDDRWQHCVYAPIQDFKRVAPLVIGQVSRPKVIESEKRWSRVFHQNGFLASVRPIRLAQFGIEVSATSEGRLLKPATTVYRFDHHRTGKVGLPNTNISGQQ